MLPKKLNWEMSQDVWATQIDPVLANPIVKGNLLQNVSLINGTNVINHKLGRKLQGWYITRIRAAATIYDTQDTNQTPQLTLNLVSDADVVIDLEVF